MAITTISTTIGGNAVLATLLTGLVQLLLVLPRPVNAHGGLNNYTVGDTWYRGFDPHEPLDEQLGEEWLVQRPWYTIDPIFSPSSPFLACNTPGSPAQASIPITAGENITALYYYWLHPVGPMSVWLAPCPSDGGCAALDHAADARWFKIWEAGLLSGNLETGTWYQKGFQKWDGEPAEWDVAIPRNLKGGEYLIRHEIISVHVANKPQFYPECAHLVVEAAAAGEAEVVGVLPPEDDGGWYKSFPGEYSMEDPNIRIDIYSEEARQTTNYTVPGGPMWDGFEY